MLEMFQMFSVMVFTIISFCHHLLKMKSLMISPVIVRNFSDLISNAFPEINILYNILDMCDQKRRTNGIKILENMNYQYENIEIASTATYMFNVEERDNRNKLKIGNRTSNIISMNLRLSIAFMCVCVWFLGVKISFYTWSSNNSNGNVFLFVVIFVSFYCCHAS